MNQPPKNRYPQLLQLVPKQPAREEPPTHWVRVSLSVAGMGALIVGLMFLLWEGIAGGFGTDASVAYGVRLARDISIGLVVAAAVAWFARRQWVRKRGELEAEAQRRNAELKPLRTALAALARHSPAGMWLLDENCRVLFANASGQKIHGHVAKLGQRYPCDADDHPGGAACKQCPTRRTLDVAEPAKARGYRTDTETGEVTAVETFPVNFGDAGKYALLVEHVVTDQQRLQSTLLHQEKMAAFGLLAAGIAHDMGNPLSGVEMHLQLLDDETLSEDASESLTTARREVARLRRTIRELVDFARRRRSAATLVSVHSVVEDTLRVVRYDQRMRGIETVVEADPGVPGVHIVEDHLMQVAMNLIVNALDAMPDGGKLRIEIVPAREGVALRVHDTGVGMSRELLARCKEPLFSTKPAGEGTGLGLSMCHDIVQAAGGELELHSAPGQGTTALVTLPAPVHGAISDPRLTPSTSDAKTMNA